MRLDYRSPEYFVITAGSISIVLTIAARRIDRSLSSLSPGYFALVMATGVVPIGLAEAGLGRASRTMLILAMAAYTVLSVLYVARWVRFPNQVRKHQRAGSGFRILHRRCRHQCARRRSVGNDTV